MNPELTDIEKRLILQALKIWHGDFPKAEMAIPSVIWEDELTELIAKLKEERWDKL